jgi:hypothetical protein
MPGLLDAVDEAAARTGFSGVVRVDRSGETELASAYGFADRDCKRNQGPDGPGGHGWKSLVWHRSIPGTDPVALIV